VYIVLSLANSFRKKPNEMSADFAAGKADFVAHVDGKLQPKFNASFNPFI